MKNHIMVSLVLMFFFVFASFNLIASSTDKKEKGQKTIKKGYLINPTQSLVNINNATMWVTEEGFHDWNLASGWNGAFPNGTNVGSIFSEGIVWGGKVYDGSSPDVRVNGNTYQTGCAPVTRLFRIRPDYLTGNLASDAASFYNIPIGDVTATQIQNLRDQYTLDWSEWPVNEGAPYTDVNNNGTFEPGEDIPGIPGASQTLFIKYNDNLSGSTYQSPPIGLEITETFWAYAQSGALGNVIYKKVDLVYTGTPTSITNSQIDSMYIVQWADPDVGNSTDDFAGCDTTLNLGYAYNSGPTDAIYSGLGLAPPAAGYGFLQGVSQFTGNPNDSAIFNLEWRKGYKYVNRKPMSSFVYFAAGGNWSDPGFNYNGTLEFYNLMRGKLPIPPYPSGEPFPEEVADVTEDGVYLLTGDPVTGTGKIDGSAEGPGDRRIMVTNGPFNMSLGDTAEVVIALVYGLGNSNLQSITKLKGNAYIADTMFYSIITPANITGIYHENEGNSNINSFELEQNYPNPFNPSTKISWQSPVDSWQTLKVYDILGNEVATLVNEYRNAGNYEIDFNVGRDSSPALASGIYFYQLRVGDPSSGSGQSFIEIKKMILLK